MTQVYEVIVIGCGAAGVSAISRLTQNNVQVLGLEASSRLGGRINTVNFGKNVIDLGAQWCHGEKNNAVYELIKDLNVVSPPSGQSQTLLVKSDGIIFNENDFINYLNACSNIMKSANNLNKTGTKSLSNYIRQEYDKYLSSPGFIGNKEVAKTTLEWYLKSIQAKVSANELLERSLNSVKESWDNEGEQLLNWRDKGFKTIIDILLHKYPDPSKALPVSILFNKEVMNIKWNNILKENKNSSPLVQIQCRDGSLYTAKHAIITVSLGVLKERYEKLFTPTIPDDKIMSIRSLAMCTMNKIYMRFSQRWWPYPLMSFAIAWTKNDMEVFSGEDDWLTGVYAISTVEMQDNLLCAWVTGTAADNMELCSREEVYDGMYRLMQHFLGKNYQVPLPTEILRSTWFTNTLTRGSFSYRSIETECVDKGAATLAEPLTNSEGIPIVCFAGEATSLRHHSCVHGAIESGFREADRLISSLKKD